MSIARAPGLKLKDTTILSFSMSSPSTPTAAASRVPAKMPASPDVALPEENDCYCFESVASKQYMAFSLSDKTIRIFRNNESMMNQVSTLKGHRDMIQNIRFVHSEEHLLVSASRRRVLMLWDLRASSRRAMRVQPGKEITGELTSMDTHPSSPSVVACGFAEGGVALWDVRKGLIPSSLTYAHSDEVTQLCWHPTKHNVVVSGSEDGQVCALDVRQPDEDDAVLWCGNVGNTVRRMGLFGHSSKYLFVLTGSETLSLWEVGEDRMQNFPKLREQFGEGEWAVDYLIDCTYNQRDNELILAMGTNGGDIVLAQVTPRVVKPLRHLKGGHCAVVRCALFQNQRLLTAGEDARICTWTPQVAGAEARPVSGKFPSQTSTRRRAAPYTKR